MNARAPNPTHADLLAVLQHHIGENDGVTCKDLAAAVGCQQRHVRTLVKHLRLEGTAVCGHPTTGYFIAKTAEELESTCQFLRRRSLSSLLQESRLRKIPMADLLGQMKLAT